MSGRRRVYRVEDPRRLREEADTEIRFHFEERVEELIAAGMSRVDAEVEIRRRFGDPERVLTEVAAIDRRGYRQRSVLERVGDCASAVRYALRGMIARPGYAAVVILTLALAVGANTAIFSAVDAVLLHPLPVPEMERVLTIQWDAPEMSAYATPLSAGEANDLAKRADLFSAVTAFVRGGATLTDVGEARRVVTAATTGDFAAVFGVRPELGSFYSADASTPGNELVVVISHALWASAFASDPSVVGRTLTLDDRAFTVVGVMPADFHYPGETEVWRPFALTPRALSPERRRTLNMMVMARLRPGVSEAGVAQRLATDVEHWQQEFGGYNDGKARFALVPLRDHISGPLGSALIVLFGAVSFVLLIACANVASLQLVRTTARGREIGVRLALGAGRTSVVLQQVVESALFALFGGLLGVLIGAGALRLLSRWGGAEHEVLSGVELDGTVLAFTTVVTVVAGLVFGALPAWRASKAGVAQSTLKESGRTGMGPGGHRLLEAAVVAQLALALVLLLGSGVVVRSLDELLRIDPGFDPDGVVTMQLTPPNSRYGGYAARVEVYRSVLERVRALPGVQAAGLTGSLPFSDMILDSSPFAYVGAAPENADSILHATAIPVSGDVFAALGIRVTRGRSFTDSDGDRNPTTGAWDDAVVIIDDQFAKQYFPGADPVGRQIDHYGFQHATIVGVVESVNQKALGAAYKANVYFPIPQLAVTLPMGIAVKSSMDPAVVTRMVADAVREVDPELPIYDSRTMEERMIRSLGDRSLAASVLGGFALLALGLSLLGTYGVLSYTTARRTHELGIRMAIGARPDDVVGMVLKKGSRLAAVGLAIGLLVYLGLSRALQSLVYGIGPRDPLTIGVGITLLLATAVFASWLPARRASRVSPVRALRID